jgi:hypothetical protein
MYKATIMRLRMVASSFRHYGRWSVGRVCDRIEAEAALVLLLERQMYVCFLFAITRTVDLCGFPTAIIYIYTYIYSS